MVQLIRHVTVSYFCFQEIWQAVDKFKAWLNKIFVVPAPWAYLIDIPCFIFVGIVLVNTITGPVAYVAYLASAYALVSFSIAIVRDMYNLPKRIKESRFYGKLVQMPFIGKLITDDSVRIWMSLYFGVAVNVLYVILKITTGIVYKSSWLIFFGGYYFALALMRFFIIDTDRITRNRGRDLRTEYRRYLLCAVSLFVLNIFLAFIIKMAANLEAVIEYPGFLIFGMAFYAFYAIITTTISVIKYRKHETIMFSAAKVSSFTAAMVSMLSLEIAMTARFGAEDIAFRKMMTSVTGFFILAIVLVMAVLMIIRASRFLLSDKV